MDGLPRLQNDILTKTLVVIVSVLALLSLAAIFAQPARASLTDAADAEFDQVNDVAETTTPTDNGAPSGKESDSVPVEEIVVEEIVVEEVLPTAEETVEVVEESVEVAADAPPIAEDMLEVVEDVPPVVEDLSVVVDAAPTVEVVEEVPPLVETVEEVLPVSDVVIMVPLRVVDFIEVLPWLVPDAVATPAPIEVPANPATPSLSNAREVSLTSPPVKDGSHQSSGLFTKQLVAEMALFHLSDLTRGSAASESSAVPVPERETAPMAAYVPIAGTVPVVGAGASSSAGSSPSGSNSFSGFDAFDFFAAMAALLALYLVGWIRDRSRSGRSIFPSHGGRPG